MIGIADCCARARSGQATAAPPRTVMNSRRRVDPAENMPCARAKTSTLRPTGEVRNSKQTASEAGQAPCLSWVIRVVLIVRRSLPATAKRTYSEGVGMSQRCQFRKSPSHSITRSAAVSTSGGTVRFSAAAVFRLKTSSNLVGNSTGRSLGFSPRKILTAYVTRPTILCLRTGE